MTIAASARSFPPLDHVIFGKTIAQKTWLKDIYIYIIIRTHQTFIYFRIDVHCKYTRIQHSRVLGFSYYRRAKGTGQA